MKCFSTIATAALAIVATLPVQAAVTVYGNSNARGCYEAARDGRSGAGEIRNCAEAIADRTLSARDRVATLVNRGILYVRSGDFENGLADYERALTIDAEEPDAYLNKALALLRRNQSGEGLIPLFDAAIRLGTEEPAVAHYGRGVAHELNGDIVSAYNDIRRASELAPQWEAPAQDLTRFVVREE